MGCLNNIYTNFKYDIVVFLRNYFFLLNPEALIPLCRTERLFLDGDRNYSYESVTILIIYNFTSTSSDPYILLYYE